MLEKTLVLIKPDGVQRKLIGKIISSFEKADIQIVALKMLTPSIDILSKHYPETDKWFSSVGEKTIHAYKRVGLEVSRDFGTNDQIAIGKKVKEYMTTFISSGNIVVLILEGNLVIQKVRQICGETFPAFADIHSLRGKFGSDSADLAYAERRSVYNLIHASSSLEEANFEIKLWFPEFATG